MTWKTRYGAGAVRVYRALIDPLLRTLRPKIVHLCREAGAARVLDIATATGDQCRRLGRVGIQATGLDLSEEMVSTARRIDGRNVRYVRGSACALPFDPASFDAALLILALHEHSEEERTAMLREAARVVGPDGALIVADFQPPRHPTFHVPWQVIRSIESVAGQEHRTGFHDFVARGGLDGLIERHELAVIQRVPSHFGTIGIARIRCETASSPTAG